MAHRPCASRPGFTQARYLFAVNDHELVTDAEIVRRIGLAQVMTAQPELDPNTKIARQAIEAARTMRAIDAETKDLRFEYGGTWVEDLP